MRGIYLIVTTLFAVSACWGSKPYPGKSVRVIVPF